MLPSGDSADVPVSALAELDSLPTSTLSDAAAFCRLPSILLASRYAAWWQNTGKLLTPRVPLLPSEQTIVRRR